MTTTLAIIFAFLWNLIGAAIMAVPLGIIFLFETAVKKVSRGIYFYIFHRPLKGK